MVPSKSDGSQLPVTSAPGILISSFQFFRHLYIPLTDIHVYLNTMINFFKKNFSKLLPESYSKFKSLKNTRIESGLGVAEFKGQKKIVT